VAAGTVSELVREHVGGDTRITLATDRAVSEVAGLEPQPGGGFIADLDNVAADLPRLLDAIHNSGARITHLQLHQPSLEEVFLNLTGKDLRE
jgi:ABC-2 type transport system ATP-binding protein